MAAFAAGLVSFLSPCVLPLIPGYLSFMTGLTASELADEDRSTAKVMVPALLFVLGFSLVFMALGASASVLGQFLTDYRGIIDRVAGIAVMVFGVYMLGVIRIPGLYGEARADMGRSRSFGRAAALVMGMAFAAGWTPCVGPILGSILALAASTGSIGAGALLLFVYSLGLGVPFLAVAFLFGRLTPLLRWLNTRSLIVSRIAGAVLIGIGVLIFSGRLTVLATWLTGFVPHLNI